VNLGHVAAVSTPQAESVINGVLKYFFQLDYRTANLSSVEEWSLPWIGILLLTLWILRGQRHDVCPHNSTLLYPVD
jgi:hypothetical protein